jgi:adenylate cyclase
MSDKSTKITFSEYASVFIYGLGAILITLSAVLIHYEYNYFLGVLGFLFTLGAYFTTSKFIQKYFPQKKQVYSGLLIGLTVALVIYKGFFFYDTGLFGIEFLKGIEEKSVSFRYTQMKGQVGKIQKISGDETKQLELVQVKGARQDIRIIGITTETLEKLKGTWPIHWSTYAKVIEGFKDSTNLLYFDIFFVDDKKGQTELLVDALKKNSNVVLDYSIESTTDSKRFVDSLEEKQEALRKYKLVNIQDPVGYKVWLSFASPPLAKITELSSGVGFANIKKEGSNANRRMPLVIKLINHGPNEETEYFPSIDLVTVCKFYGVDVVKDTEVVLGEYVKIKNIPNKKITTPNGEEDIMKFPNPEREITIPIDHFGQMEINFVGSLFSFKDDDLYDVAEWGKEYAANFKDTIFLVAMYYATGRGASKDTHLSPYGEMSGIEHHAHAINTILNQDFIRTTPDYLNLFILILIGLTIGFIQSYTKTYASFILFIGSVIVYFLISIFTFSYFDLIIPLPSVLFELLLVFVLIVVYKILNEEENVKYIRNTFSKFVSKDVVDELLKHPEKIALGGSRREITIFFSDVRGFTTLSEALSPEELVRLLNEYLSAMTENIIQYKGTIDKYMGDAIMAFWGAPIDLEDHAYFACVSALDQMAVLKKLQGEWKNRNLPSIDIGIGLNTGPAVVGNMGSSQRMDYTVMGDTINLGSRLEGSNKMYGTNIIMSEYTYERVKERVYARELDLVQVKGKTHPVRIYELIGLVDDTAMQNLKRPISSN